MSRCDKSPTGRHEFSSGGNCVYCSVIQIIDPDTGRWVIVEQPSRREQKPGSGREQEPRRNEEKRPL